jgi:Methane oxygenase PmoA
MRLLIAALLLVAPLAATAADETVRLKKSDGKIDVLIGSEPFATFHFKGFKKPFLADLRAPGGIVITRSLEKEAVTDHPHHKGLWVGVDEINEHKHWMEAQPVRTATVMDVKAQGNPASFFVNNTWLDEKGEPLMTEQTFVEIYADRLIAYDMTLSPAGDEPITFGDTKEGFFAVRVRDELREKGGTGKITNAHGAVTEKETWGKTAPWVDYSGTVEGQPVGVAIFDDPENVRPSRYHVRAYGLFAISPFGEGAYTNGEKPAQPITLKPGEKLRLRYAAYVHTGDAESADVAGRYQRYLENTRKQ